MRERLREEISYDKFRFDRSKSLLSLTTIVFRWVLVISVVMWVAMGLVSLRFDLSVNFEDIFYSQLIIAGIIAVAMANLYVMEMGGFGGSRWAPYSVLAPTLSGILSGAGLLLLLWYVWTDFTVGPNELMKTTYSLLGVGLCGTFAGFVTLPFCTSQVQAVAMGNVRVDRGGSSRDLGCAVDCKGTISCKRW